MKTRMMILLLACLSLLAGLTYARIAPSEVVDLEVATPAPVQLPDSLTPILSESQGLTCGPNLGNCNSVSFGFCDCDVPTPDFSCDSGPDIDRTVLTCYGTTYCQLGPPCTP